MLNNEEKFFDIYVCRSLENVIFLDFFLKFQGFMGSFEEKLTRKIHTIFLYMFV